MLHDLANYETRRYFLQRSGVGLGAGRARVPHERRRPRAGRYRRIAAFRRARQARLFTFSSPGAPSQMDLFDYKPRLRSMFGNRPAPTQFAAGNGSPA